MLERVFKTQKYKHKGKIMIANLNVGTRPIYFTFTQSDIIKIDEGKGLITLADSFDRVYKDTIDDGLSSTADVVITNSFPTMRQVYTPYIESGSTGTTANKITLLGSSGSQEDLLVFLKNKIATNAPFNIECTGSVESLSDSKIVTYNMSYVEN
ncbi:MAG TPA: hypothetical protein EYG85_08820 [Crocinitomix sp.]|nr:hypothetical protein [Crocinitomix sp.]